MKIFIFFKLCTILIRNIECSDKSNRTGDKKPTKCISLKHSCFLCAKAIDFNSIAFIYRKHNSKNSNDVLNIEKNRIFWSITNTKKIILHLKCSQDFNQIKLANTNPAKSKLLELAKDYKHREIEANSNFEQHSPSKTQLFKQSSATKFKGYKNIQIQFQFG